MKQLLILLFCVMILASCSKDNQNTNSSNTDSQGEELDTAALEKDEMFGAVLTNDFLNEEDEELENYLMTQIYPLVSTSKKVTIDKISGSEYMLIYDEANNTKRMLVKKYYNPLTEEVFFERSEYTEQSK